MPAKSTGRLKTAKRKTRTSLVGMKIYPASVEPSPRLKRILETVACSTAKVVPKGRTLKQVVRDLPKGRRAGIEKRTKVLVAEELALRKRGRPKRR